MSGCTCRAPKEIDRLRRGGLDALAGRGRPACRLGEHAQHGRLVQGKGSVASADPEDDLLGRDEIAVRQCLHDRARLVGEDVTDEIRGLPHAAQDGVLAAKDLHRDHGIDALAVEDAAGSGEVDVGRRAGQDLVRRAIARQAHQATPTVEAALKVTFRPLPRPPGPARRQAQPGVRQAGV